MILCWAAFIAILRRMRSAGCGLDTPVRLKARDAHKPPGIHRTALQQTIIWPKISIVLRLKTPIYKRTYNFHLAEIGVTYKCKVYFALKLPRNSYIYTYFLNNSRRICH